MHRATDYSERSTTHHALNRGLSGGQQSTHKNWHLSVHTPSGGMGVVLRLLNTTGAPADGQSKANTQTRAPETKKRSARRGARLCACAKRDLFARDFNFSLTGHSGTLRGLEPHTVQSANTHRTQNTHATMQNTVSRRAHAHRKPAAAMTSKTGLRPSPHAQRITRGHTPRVDTTESKQRDLGLKVPFSEPVRLSTK